MSSLKKSAILHKLDRVISRWQSKYLDNVCWGIPTCLANSETLISPMSIFKFFAKISTILSSIFLSYTKWCLSIDFTPIGVIKFKYKFM